MQIFITGIDTDAGKTYATAWLARRFMDQGLSVVTQKFIQTGNVGSSEDIEAHRRLLGHPPLPEDVEGLTAPVIFSFPASAQLAARVDGRDIDLGLIARCTATLDKRYDVVLVEGAGGLMVPISDTYMTIDYLTEHPMPVVLVTNGRLGSINHTILSLEAIAARGLELHSVVFNHHFDYDPVVTADTLGFIRRWCARHFPEAKVVEMPSFQSLKD